MSLNKHNEKENHDQNTEERNVYEEHLINQMEENREFLNALRKDNQVLFSQRQKFLLNKNYNIDDYLSPNSFK